MLNKICLIGNVGHTPEVKVVGDAKVANFSVGVTERGYTKKDGTKVEDKTEWFSCQAWRGLGETVERYVHKGDKLYVEGKMTSRKYIGNDGIEKTAWEVSVSNIELLTPKSASQAGTEAPVTIQKASKPIDTDNDLPF